MSLSHPFSCPTLGFFACDAFFILYVDCLMDTSLQQLKHLRKSRRQGLGFGVAPFVHLIMKRVCLHVIFVGFFVILWLVLAAMETKIQV